MSRRSRLNLSILILSKHLPFLALLFCSIFLLGTTKKPLDLHEALWRHRNLGKAYYENPMTQLKAVEEFKNAVALTPNSARDRVNYGLALLRAGMTKEAIAELLKAQKQDPSIPHTWFNLGIAYKKAYDHERAIAQFEGMLKLVPDEPVTHYNLGIEYKLSDKADLALRHFETSARLNPNFAAPHFQLYNAYRELGRKDDAARELEYFNDIKKRKAGAAVAEDPEWSYYSEIYDVVEMDGEFDQGASSPAFKFVPKKVASGVDAATAGLAVIDFDGDGHPDLLVWFENGVMILKNGATPVANTGLENLKEVVSIAPGDFNNDGLADLAVITHAGAELYLNRNGKFEPYPAKLPAGTFTKAIWLDYDHDYDLDLILLGSKSVLLRNEGSAGFSDQSSHFPFASGRAVDAALFELVPDNNESDLAVEYDDGSTVVYHDKLLGHYEAEPQPQLGQANGRGYLQGFDINNDGWPDLVLTTSSEIRLFLNDHGKLVKSAEPLPIPSGLSDHAGETAAPSITGSAVLADLANRAMAELIVSGSVYRSLGHGKFEPAHAESLPRAVTMAEADFDGDGRVDLAVVTADGSVELLKNDTVTTNHFIEVHLEGVKNIKLAVGAVVEVKAGAWYQKKTYAGVPLSFGLRNYLEADTVRITWPNGLVQNEIKQAAGNRMAYKEKPRLSGSCPMIFAWNGKKFEFITDVLGVAPLGASNGEGDYFPVNHREYIRIPDGALDASGNHYEVRITEELREVSYLDKIQLVAVDHTANEEILTNDKFTGPPFPKFRLFGVERKHYPVRAKDQEGTNVLPQLVQRDGRYVDSFHRNSSGVAELHFIDLDFGTAAPENRAVLVLSGWVDWADGSTFRAAGQESKEGLIFPYLQVKDAAGKWQTVIQDMGMPSGKPKTIVVDLAGKFLSKSREIRIVTNLCVYWDEIFLSEQTAPPTVRITHLEPRSADLRYRGFSQPVIYPERTQPEKFDYETWSATTMWNPTPGLYTRYGEVAELLQSMDDRMVIMGSGDEVRLLFNARSLLHLPAGWKRSFLLLVDGWAKDADANTAYSRSVEPLPFHGMVSYPYPTSQHFPDDKTHRAYRQQYNTRSPIGDLGLLRSAE